MAVGRITKKRFENIINTANAHGFDVVSESRLEGKTPFSNETILFVCNTCGATIEKSLTDKNILGWLQAPECPNAEHCKLDEDDLRKLTESGALLWCEDVLGTLRDLFTCSESYDKDDTLEDGGVISSKKTFDIFQHKNFQKIYFTCINNAIHLIFECGLKNGCSNFLYGEFKDISDGSLYRMWPLYDAELIELIKKQLTGRDELVHSTMVYDRYVEIYNSLINGLQAHNDSDAYMVGMKLMYAIRCSNAQTDKMLEKYLKLHRCPVCGRYYTSTATECSKCGFDGVNKMFISRADAEDWQKNYLYPYQVKYWRDAMEISDCTLIKYNRRTGSLDEFIVQVPYGITCIGERAFGLSYGLYEVIFPPTIQVIQAGAFMYSDLMLLFLPKGLKEIAACSFAWCSNLVDVIIPNTVEIIGEDAFYACNHLGNIFCEAKAKPGGWDTMWNHLGQNRNNEEVYAQIHWGGTWHYENGRPIPNDM